MMAPTIALAPDGSPRLVVGSAGSARLRGAIMQIVVNVLEHGLGVEEAIDAPRIHVDEPHVHCEGGHDPAELDRLAARRLRPRPLAAPEPVLRRRGGGRDASRRDRGRRRRPAPRRRRGARRMSVTRPEGRSRRRAARSSSSRARSPPSEEGWLLADSRWRSAGDERRYIRVLQRHPDAALYVAELEDGELVGRLSLMRDPHPASSARRRPRADGRRRPPPPRDRDGADGRSPRSGRGRRA